MCCCYCPDSDGKRLITACRTEGRRPSLCFSPPFGEGGLFAKCHAKVGVSQSAAWYLPGRVLCSRRWDRLHAEDDCAFLHH